MTGYEKSFDSESMNIFITVYNIALVFQFQGKHEKALQWYERALTGFETLLDPDHSDIILTIHGMAMMFKLQGDYKKALVFYQRLLASQERTLGPKHQSTKRFRKLVNTLTKKVAKQNRQGGRAEVL